MEIFKTLKEKRKVLHLTQQQLAETSGVSLRTIKLIEGGTGNPSVAIVAKLCDVLQLELQLLPRQGSEKKPDFPYHDRI